MIENDEFSAFRQLQSVESPVSAAIFENIMAEKRKRKRVIAWWSAMGVFCLFAIGFILFYPNSSTNFSKTKNIQAILPLNITKNTPTLTVETLTFMSSQSTTASQNQLPIINQTQKIVPAVVIDGINASVSTIEPKNQLPTIAKIPQIELSKINIKQQNYNITNSNELITPITKITKKRSIWQPKWGIYANAQQANRTLTAKTETENNYRNFRDSVETSFGALGGGVSFELENSKGFTIRTGLNYQQQNELLAYKNPRFRINPNSADKEAKYVSIADSTYNRYRSINIPLEIGYQVKKVSLHGGILMNVLAFQKGHILGKNLAPQLLSEENVYRKNWGIAYTFAVVTQIKSFNIEPNIQYNPKNVLKNDNTLQQKYWFYGLKIGLDLPFKNNKNE